MYEPNKVLSDFESTVQFLQQIEGEREGEFLMEFGYDTNNSAQGPSLVKVA